MIRKTNLNDCCIPAYSIDGVDVTGCGQSFKLYSYEMNYDVGSIGKKLDFDEWRESQAWQALSLYEAYRKKRWLGFDGMNWCPMRGGGNTATYLKPMLD